jgi:hypothetical protein
MREAQLNVEVRVANISGNELAQVLDVTEIARNVISLHDAKLRPEARKLAQDRLPWTYDFEKALGFFAPFMAKHAGRIRAIGAAFEPDDLASIAMMEAERYLRGSWGHAVAIADGATPETLWQHPAFRTSAEIYGRRCIGDLRRSEQKEKRSSKPNQDDAESNDGEQRPREYQFVVTLFSRLAKDDQDEGDWVATINDETVFDQGESQLREERRVEAELAIAEASDALSADDQFVLGRLTAWYATHENLWGFYEDLIAAYAAIGQAVRPDTARQRVRSAQQRIFGTMIPPRRKALRAALISTATPHNRDPLTFVERIAVAYLIEIAGTVAWRTAFDRIRAHLKELEVDTVAPWDKGDTAGEALDKAFGTVVSTYRYLHGRSFWATRD